MTATPAMINFDQRQHGPAEASGIGWFASMSGAAPLRGERRHRAKRLFEKEQAFHL
jgi:hypothetical protein